MWNIVAKQIAGMINAVPTQQPSVAVNKPIESSQHTEKVSRRIMSNGAPNTSSVNPVDELSKLADINNGKWKGGM